MERTRSLAATLSPTLTWMASTVPATGAARVVSIFIADKIKRGSPTSTAWPCLARSSMTTPGIGAPTEPGTFASAFGLWTCFSVECSSSIFTDRGDPFSSKKTSRVPVFWSRVPTPSNLTTRCLPRSMSMSTVSPASKGSMNSRVGKIDTSPNFERCAWNSSKTLGYMTADIRSVSESTRSFSRRASKSTGSNSAPGLPENVFGFPADFRTSDRSGSGNPPTGMPRAPWKNSTTEEGNDKEAASLLTSSAVRELVTMNCARSPTVLEEGVTFTMSPRSKLASA
mmetsp:Transcript_14871/g.45023  ORF Transcript_14871/g.45023 Transcript_14871/m.45023 type:complete len:283 (-) Transcript_14871:1096-1944(-)